MSDPSQQEPPSSLWQQIVEDLRPHIRSLVLGLFIILRVTILLLLSIAAADWILASVSSSLQPIVSQVPYLANVLLGLKILAAIGLAITYVVYVAVSLYVDVSEQIHRLPPRRPKRNGSDPPQDPPEEPPGTGAPKQIEDTNPPDEQGGDREAPVRERAKR